MGLVFTLAYQNLIHIWVYDKNLQRSRLWQLKVGFGVVFCGVFDWRAGASALLSQRLDSHVLLVSRDWFGS